jgi:hypothetical protein
MLANCRSIQQATVPGDTANETDSEWRIDFTGVGGGRCTLKWYAIRKWSIPIFVAGPQRLPAIHRSTRQIASRSCVGTVSFSYIGTYAVCKSTYSTQSGDLWFSVRIGKENEAAICEMSSVAEGGSRRP